MQPLAINNCRPNSTCEMDDSSNFEDVDSPFESLPDPSTSFTCACGTGAGKANVEPAPIINEPIPISRQSTVKATARRLLRRKAISKPTDPIASASVRTINNGEMKVDTGLVFAT